MNGNENEKNDEHARDEKRDDDLAQRVAELARAIEPSSDLWAGVSARIEAKKKRVIVLRRVVTTASVLLAAASVMLMLRTTRHPVVSNQAVPAPIVSEQLPTKRAHAMLDQRGAAVVPEEESYDTALAALTPALDAHLDTLPKADADAITKSIDVINQGIDATRAALARDPDDADLRTALDDQYEQEIQTMNDVLDWTTRS